MIIKKVVCYFCLLLICSACSDEQKIREALKGTWSIDSYAPSNEFIFQTYCSNMLEFKGRICYLPTPCINEKREGEEGKWFLSKEDDVYYITIEAVRNYLSGRYKIAFAKDHANKLLKLYLISDSNTIICSKFMLYYSEFVRVKIPKGCEVNTAK